MPTRTSKTTQAAPKKTVKKVTKKVSSRAVSKKAPVRSQKSRTNFVASIVVVAAALVAIAIGFSTYTKPAAVVADASSGLGSMYLKHQNAENLTAGSTLKVDLYENSGSEPVNAIQGAVNYPADKLQFVSVVTSESFPQEAATDSATAGLVRIARAVHAQAPSLTGVKPIATLEFKVLEDSATPIKPTLDLPSSLLVRSTDNKNIL